MFFLSTSDFACNPIFTLTLYTRNRKKETEIEGTLFEKRRILFFFREMGICSNFAQLLFRGIKDGSSRDFPMTSLPSDTIVEETRILFVDITQWMYGISSCQRDKVCRIVEYHTPMDFLQSNDPIGSIEFDVITGRVVNRIEKFQLSDTADILVQRTRSLLGRWSFESRSRSIESRISHLFLVLDGDTPKAKTQTRRKRILRSQTHCLQRNMKEWMEKNGLSSDFESSLHFHKFQNDEEGFYYGSIQRFLQSREYRSHILDEFISKLADMDSEFKCHIYLVAGPKEKAKSRTLHVLKKKGMPIVDLPKEVPYREADVIIPHLWTSIRGQVKGRACFLSNDSDAIITLLALKDPRLFLLTRVGSRAKGDKGWSLRDRDVTRFMKDMSAFVFTPKLLEEPETHLDLLLHLTMGGTDYVETFPRCGPVTLLKGAKIILSVEKRIFKNVAFLEEGDDKVSFHINFLHTKEVYRQASQLLLSQPNLFPIRLGDQVYFVKLLQDARNSSVLEWYNGKKKISQSEFVASMRRRLFFLSLISDSHFDIENRITLSTDFSLRCGYDREKDYTFVDPMISKK